mmetsp:Transcript_2624/g.6705  ORF Transcript_2624/g.6705 Transcript_2624/m.6705 type:complete len:332 (-) Transcript_2624:652-1647(-)
MFKKLVQSACLANEKLCSEADKDARAGFAREEMASSGQPPSKGPLFFCCRKIQQATEHTMHCSDWQKSKHCCAPLLQTQYGTSVAGTIIASSFHPEAAACLPLLALPPSLKACAQSGSAGPSRLSGGPAGVALLFLVPALRSRSAAALHFFAFWNLAMGWPPLRITMKRLVHLLRDLVRWPLQYTPQGVQEGRPPAVAPPIGWSTGFMATPLTLGRRPLCLLVPAFPALVSLRSRLDTTPTVAWQFLFSLRISPEGRRTTMAFSSLNWMTPLVPAALAIVPPWPGNSSMLWMCTPKGMSLSLRVLPAWMGAFCPARSTSPTFRPSGARWYL